jgi:hypothetical protein
MKLRLIRSLAAAPLLALASPPAPPPPAPPSQPSAGSLQGASATSSGVAGTSSSGYGVLGASQSGTGVYGSSNGAWPAAGVYGTTSATGGTAVAGVAQAASSVGVWGQGTSMGVQGYSTGTNGSGTSGVASGTGGHALDGVCNGACATGYGYAGYFTGNVHVTGNVSVASLTTRSDERAKTQVEDAPYGLAHLLRLHPVTYRRKEDAGEGAVQIGLLAQEVQAVLPELVRADGSGALSLDALGLLPVAIKAVQEQQRTIRRLEARIDRLERRCASAER